jgi:hypothetical protein
VTNGAGVLPSPALLLDSLRRFSRLQPLFCPPLTVLLYLARVAASQISMRTENREQKSFVEMAVDEAKLREQAIDILLRHREWRRVPQSPRP